MGAPILGQIQALGHLTSADERAFLAVCRVRPLATKDFVSRAGEVCDALTFVNSGLLRIFFHAEAQERTCRFLPENSWYTDFESFSRGTPSLENLQALEDSEVVQIRKADLDQLYRDHPNLERVGRLLTEQALLEIHQRNRMLTLDTPEVRYDRLCSESPALVNRIPQYYLASYLNIRPESLSRIRKRR